MTTQRIWASTIQKSNLWLKALAADLGWSNAENTLLALRTVLHALRDRLTPSEAAQLGAQLPLLMKGVYYDGWNPSRAPVRVRSREEFVELVRPALERGIAGVDVERTIRAVFRLIETYVSEGEIEDVRRMLPKELEELWPARSAV